jgi:hypothetical protein
MAFSALQRVPKDGHGQASNPLNSQYLYNFKTECKPLTNLQQILLIEFLPLLFYPIRIKIKSSDLISNIQV